MIPVILDHVLKFLRPIDLRVIACAFHAERDRALSQTLWWHLAALADPKTALTFEIPATESRKAYFDRLNQFCELCGKSKTEQQENNAVDQLPAPPQQAPQPAPQQLALPAPPPAGTELAVQQEEAEAYEYIKHVSTAEYGICEECSQGTSSATAEDRLLFAQFRTILRTMAEDSTLRVGLYQLRRLKSLMGCCHVGEVLVVDKLMDEFRSEFVHANFSLAQIEREVAFPRRMGEQHGLDFRENFLQPFLDFMAGLDDVKATQKNQELEELERQQDQARFALQAAANIGRRGRKKPRLMKSLSQSQKDIKWAMKQLAIVSASIVEDLGTQWHLTTNFLECWSLGRELGERLAMLSSVLSHPHILPLAVAIFQLTRDEVVKDLTSLDLADKRIIWKAYMWALYHLEAPRDYSRIEHIAISAVRLIFPPHLRHEQRRTAEEIEAEKAAAEAKEKELLAVPEDPNAWRRVRKGQTIEDAAKQARLETQAALASLQALMTSQENTHL